MASEAHEVTVVAPGLELEQLIRRLGPMVYRRACAILRNPEDARDVTQDVFLQALRAGPVFQQEASSWLYRVTTNACLNRLRSGRRYQAMKARNSAGGEPPNLQRPDAEHLVRELLANSDSECAAAAIYVFIEGMSHEEAADLLGVSRRTVGNLLDRFVAWAREKLEVSAVPADEITALDGQL
jgi:RNA polymerase sigma-70 factor (ECF subfamily)